MKKLIFVSGILFFSASLMAVMNASVKDFSKLAPNIITVELNKEKILVNDLPQSVLDALSEDLDKGWKIMEVYLITENPDSYQVILMKDTITKMINLDRDGKVVVQIT